MPIALDVNVLPRGQASRTRKLYNAFFDTWLEKDPERRRISLNLADDYRSLPVFDEWDITAKFEMLYGEGKLDERGAERWAALTQLTDQLHSADMVVITAPMWNFSIPWHLKRWIDCVVQGRLTFEYLDGQFRGLLGGRPAVLLTSRDGIYTPGTELAALDFQVPYLRTILGLIGLNPIHEVIAEPMMLAGPDAGVAALQVAVDKARALAESL
ncbi:MAG TPA: NAD(P)H-dependent oxidoreductase [Pseudomonadota bacterium]|jgi:FMN-dependent NADH-azoreductase|nr:NAD(P)H-dependent oxidoreductase [Pseudomonadota bacterium]HND09538.1 NAD(P)H-dependent oxidoreductase [Pseudomonadota bacterium]HNI58502.1 NAD(P)H-dependent oxidoreductase [Pseudomonadota bacterium]HNK44673.1 NAD(P)H-dependent oxidoreductase [Pseudomonadota bacterium]HNN50954.1 NAD(P)H-dependent oxidoreductase [Pseudomonadota bacterium]